jgi:hypothetical protein
MEKPNNKLLTVKKETAFVPPREVQKCSVY